MFDIKLNDRGLQKLLTAVEIRARAVGGLAGATAIYERLGSFALRDVQDNFQRQGPPLGPPWVPLAPATQAQRRKQRKHPSRPILVREGTVGGLRGSIHAKAFPNRAIVAANKVYDAMLHYGAAAGSLWKGTYTVPAHRVKSHKRKTRAGRTVKIKAHTRKAYTRKGQAPWGDVPARPYMTVGPEFYRRANRFLGRYIITGRMR